MMGEGIIGGPGGSMGSYMKKGAHYTLTGGPKKAGPYHTRLE